MPMTDSPRRLLILGASGRCGRRVTREAIRRGFVVTALTKSRHDHLAELGARVLNGNVLDYATLVEAMRGQNAVACCLGIKRKSAVNPLSDLLSPPDFMTRCAGLIIRAMNETGVERLVAISAAGVGDSYVIVTHPVRQLLKVGHLKTAYADLGNMEPQLISSSRDTLIVRPVTLTDLPVRSNARIIERYGLLSMISRDAVARWIVDALERPGRYENAAENIG